jgi:hypothetical protein
MAQDLRARRLAALDAYSRDYVEAARRTIEAGEQIAKRDIAGLTTLADQVIVSLGVWRDQLDRLDFALRTPLSLTRAARAVSETVFDDVLEPEATRVFAAAIDLSL